MTSGMGNGAEPDGFLARARAGDGEAFCRLMEGAEARLFRQAAALTGDLSAAEDLVAETMAAAWQSLGRFDGACRLSTWLYAILLHRFRKHLRRLQSRPRPAATCDPAECEDGQLVLDSQEDGRPTASESMLARESSERLRRAVADLPAEHRDVLLLRFFEDASLAEIAVALGIPVGTVKSRLHHALERLRGRVEVVNLWAERRDA